MEVSSGFNSVELCGAATTSKKNRRAFVIETSSPIDSSENRSGFSALLIGLILALHTPLWLGLVFYKEKVWENDEDAAVVSKTIALLRFLSRWLLEFTPWFANALLSLFLGVLFILMGFSTAQVSNPTNK